MKSNIVFREETHLDRKDVNRVEKSWPGQLYFSCTHAREVMILIHRCIPFQLNTKIVDPLWRYIILHGSIFSTEVNFIKIYAPNGDDPYFYQNFFLTLSSYNGQYIIGGHLNCVLDPALDRSSGIDISYLQTRKTTKKFVVDLNLSGIWRYLNPSKK